MEQLFNLLQSPSVNQLRNSDVFGWPSSSSFSHFSLHYKWQFHRVAAFHRLQHSPSPSVVQIFAERCLHIELYITKTIHFVYERNIRGGLRAFSILGNLGSALRYVVEGLMPLNYLFPIIAKVKFLHPASRHLRSFSLSADKTISKLRTAKYSDHGQLLHKQPL